MNPVKGTEILFFEKGKWWNKNSEGVIVPTNTLEYLGRYTYRNTLVVVKGEDDEYLTNLNGGEITVVVDKEAIDRPNLLSFEKTKEWLSLTHFLKLRKMTADFCLMAKAFYIPEK